MARKSKAQMERELQMKQLQLELEQEKELLKKEQCVKSEAKRGPRKKAEKKVEKAPVNKVENADTMYAGELVDLADMVEKQDHVEVVIRLPYQKQKETVKPVEKPTKSENQLAVEDILGAGYVIVSQKQLDALKAQQEAVNKMLAEVDAVCEKMEVANKKLIQDYSNTLLDKIHELDRRVACHTLGVEGELYQLEEFVKSIKV